MTHGSQLPILPHLSMDAASVQFTIYQGSARLARKVIFRTVVGGAIGSSADNSRVVVRALENITLDIKSGDRVALLGHFDSLCNRCLPQRGQNFFHSTRSGCTRRFLSVK